MSSHNTVFLMFYGVSSFNKDLSSWGVTNIDSEPSDFSFSSSLSESNNPFWVTCPSITAIPDPAFEQALNDLGYDLCKPDSQVLTAKM